jgi:isopenicillin N synthase-like dioxygenase
MIISACSQLRAGSVDPDASGKWIGAPAIPDAFVVNGGQLLQRWTKDYFLATPHRAVNRSGGDRYALAFFCDSSIGWPVAAVPTCVGRDKRPKYPTTYYTDYMVRYQQRTYNVFGTENKDAAERHCAAPGAMKQSRESCGIVGIGGLNLVFTPSARA